HRQAIELGDVERAADLDLVGVDRNGPEGGQGTLRDAGSPFVRVTRNPVAGPIAAAAAGGADGATIFKRAAAFQRETPLEALANPRDAFAFLVEERLVAALFLSGYPVVGDLEIAEALVERGLGDADLVVLLTRGAILAAAIDYLGSRVGTGLASRMESGLGSLIGTAACRDQAEAD